MKNFNFVFLFALCALLFASGSAGAISVGDLQKKMSESDESLKTMTFEYTQIMRSGIATEVRESSGVAYVKKPKMLRIEQRSPEEQFIVADGKSVYIFTPRFHQVIRDSWDNWSSKNMLFPGMSGFSGAMSKLKNGYNWEVRGAADINGEKTIEVRLKSVSGTSENLSLWISESDYMPRKAEFVDGTLTLSTTFVSVRRNPEIAQELFRFQKPPDSEIIQMPK